MCVFFFKNLASQRNGVNSDTSYYFAGPQRWRGRIEPRCKRAFYTGWKPWGVAESRQVGFQLHLLLLLRFSPWGRTGSGEGCSPCHCVACGCPSPEPVVIINFFLPSLIPMASCATLTLLYHNRHAHSWNNILWFLSTFLSCISCRYILCDYHGAYIKHYCLL